MDNGGNDKMARHIPLSLDPPKDEVYFSITRKPYDPDRKTPKDVRISHSASSEQLF